MPIGSPTRNQRIPEGRPCSFGTSNGDLLMLMLILVHE